MPISVASRDSALRVPRPLVAALAAVVRDTLKLESRRAGEIAIAFVRDAEQRELNRRWRRIDRATDVLSFPYADDGARIDGDLVISFDRLVAQAKRYRVSVGKELARLVVHGTLHLCGHDHHRAGEREVMRTRERTALRAAQTAIPALDRVFTSPPKAKRGRLTPPRASVTLARP